MKQVELWGEEGATLWDKWAVFFNIEQTSATWTWMGSDVSDRLFDGTHFNIRLHNIPTSPAVPHGHFAHPGLSNGGTWYRVLGWFLYNVPCPRLQTPLIATGFVSPGAGSPFAPLAHLAALCRDTNKRGCWAKTTAERTCGGHSKVRL